MAELWTNWAGNQRALVEVLRPTTEAELCALVVGAAQKGQRVKAVGAGHSFTDAALTDGLLLSLEDYGRVLSLEVPADGGDGFVTVQAGARLQELSGYLWSRGLAFENLGDIDVQTLAGATSTATHGTGGAFRNLSANIVGMRIITGSGEVLECDEGTNAELLRVARVGIGALGLISTITLRVVPAFHLRVVEKPRRYDEVIEGFDDLVADNDHFEFFYVPHTDWTLTKRNQRNLEPIEPRSRLAAWQQDMLWSNHAFGLVNRVAAARPSLTPRLARLVPSSGEVHYNDRSYRVFASPRKVRFVEMEYAVPLEATTAALAEVRGWIDSTGSPTMFPVEVRAVAGDDIPLSTAHGRPTGYIAVHVYRGTPHETYFRAVESIMRAHGGRPHWGKMHFRTAADLAPDYPDWDAFQAVRQANDPDGVFANAYTDRVLGPVGT